VEVVLWCYEESNVFGADNIISIGGDKGVEEEGTGAFSAWRSGSPNLSLSESIYTDN